MLNSLDNFSLKITLFKINDDICCFSLLPYTIEELSTKKHPWELSPCGNLVLRIDYGQMGLAGENSWGALPWPEYQLIADHTYRFAFTLEAIITEFARQVK